MIEPHGEIEKINADTWPSLKDTLLSLYKSGYNFRGHKDNSWPLNSSLERYFPTFTKIQQCEYYKNAFKHMLSCGLFQELDINDVENMFNDYYTCQGDLNRFVEKHSGEEDKEFVARLNKFLKDNNTVYSIWLRMQHHNVPTHLIDTTRSFYIAAYFALFNSIKECSEKESNYPAIIATKRYYNPTGDLLQWHFSRTSHIRNVDNYIHERPWVQQAAHIDSFLPTKYQIKKLIIDPHWLSDIYFDLKLMNITGYSLFGTKEMAGLDYYFFVKFGNFI